MTADPAASPAGHEADAPPTDLAQTEAPASSDRIRRLLAVNAIVIAFLLVLRPFALGLYALREQRDIGSDWRWLQNGLNRLAAGLPLTRPAYVDAPWSQFRSGAEIPTYAWSLHPPYSATFYAPFTLVPLDVRTLAWAAAMALALGAAVWVAWPRRLWWGTALLILTLMLWLPAIARPAVIDQLHYGNPNALVVLGVALLWRGRRQGSAALMAAGLVLAALKIAPAATLGVWLLVARRDALPARRAIVAAVAILVVASVPVLIRDPGAIGDLIRSQANLIPYEGPANLAPQVRLAPLFGHDGAVAMSYGIGALVVLAILVGRLDGPGGLVLAATAPLFFTPQLWAHWFLIPAVAVFAVAGEWRVVRAIDERLRDVMGLPAPPVVST